MKILLINPPYQTFTSNFGVGHQVPLGLLMVGGALRDAGHDVRLLDAECRRLSISAIVRQVSDAHPDQGNRMFERPFSFPLPRYSGGGLGRGLRATIGAGPPPQPSPGVPGEEERGNVRLPCPPDAVMVGHAGSTPAHPVTMQLLRAIKAAHPRVKTIYGGVYPTYHAAEIIASEPAVDFVIRGEGEATAVDLARALSADPTGEIAAQVAGVTGRIAGNVISAPDRPPIKDLDAYRIAWELIDDWNPYHCFGLGRAAIVQFSRGCPHRCTYCGQHGFWVQWRHRDPTKLVDEIQWLRRTHNVRFLTLADENPTTRRDVWKIFLEELIRRDLGVHFFATIRATDLVRDADLLPLYRKAGILYVLMGIESTSDEVLRAVRKGSTTRHDLQACRLLKQNGIFSVIGHIVGLGAETPARFATTMRQLALYDGDWLNAMYVTPHDWTPFGKQALTGKVIEPDLAKWDYRHQILEQPVMSRTAIFARVKWMELWLHLRPTRLLRIARERDPLRRQQYRWVLLHTGMVWMAEVAEFIFRRLARKFSRPRDSAARDFPSQKLEMGGARVDGAALVEMTFHQRKVVDIKDRPGKERRSKAQRMLT
jgi:anaerobic magnesium-protoporphyrin IX monomethyl ester cyclase